MDLNKLSEQEVNHVSDTAFWIAYLRGEESKRPDALFNDPFAGKLAGDRGKQITKNMPSTKMTAWVVSLRTCIIDDLISRAAAEGIDTILNLGAGLDTRPYRMNNLPPSLKWIEVDYPSIIDYKAKLLKEEKPHVQLERISLDLSIWEERQAMLKTVAEKSEKIFVLTEGVVPYLSNNEVALLANDLHSVENISYWLLDYSSPEARKFLKRSKIQNKLKNSPFKFAPSSWLDFFEKHGWHTKEIRYYFNESKKHKRPVPLPLIAKTFMFFKRLKMSAEEKRKWRELNGYALLQKEISNFSIFSFF
jgi:methyltransferase (TIGR00027 family)